MTRAEIIHLVNKGYVPGPKPGSIVLKTRKGAIYQTRCLPPEDLLELDRYLRAETARGLDRAWELVKQGFKPSSRWSVEHPDGRRAKIDAPMYRAILRMHPDLDVDKHASHFDGKEDD